MLLWNRNLGNVIKLRSKGNNQHYCSSISYSLLYIYYRTKRLGLPPFPHPPSSLSITEIENTVEALMMKSYDMKSKTYFGTEAWGRSLILFSKYDYIDDELPSTDTSSSCNNCDYVTDENPMKKIMTDHNS